MASDDLGFESLLKTFRVRPPTPLPDIQPSWHWKPLFAFAAALVIAIGLAFLFRVSNLHEGALQKRVESPVGALNSKQDATLGSLESFAQKNPDQWEDIMNVAGESLLPDVK